MNLLKYVVVALYILIMFGIAWYAQVRGQRNASHGEYYLGSRSLGGFVLAMSMAATYASASSFIGGPAAGYVYGLGWVLLAMIQVPVVWLSLGALGKRFHQFSQVHDCVTISDVLMARYRHRGVVVVSCIVLLICFFAAMTVQLIGAARLLETVLGLSYTQSLLVFVVVVGLYTMIGGFRAVAWTDVVQGVFMMLGSVLLLIVLLYKAGGISQAMTDLANIDPELLSPYGKGGKLGISFMLSFWVLVCFATIGLPQSALRVMAFKDEKSLYRAMWIGTIVLSIIMLSMHLSGVLGRLFLHDVPVPDQMMPMLMLKVLPTWVWILFLFAPMSAIMSTMDAYLIQASAVVVRDIWQLCMGVSVSSEKITTSREQRKNYGIHILLLLGLFFAALYPPDLLIWLNLFAFGGLEACFFWVLVLGIFWNKSNAWGAISAMLGGFISYIIFYLFKTSLMFHPIVYALGSSFALFLLGNWVADKWCRDMN